MLKPEPMSRVLIVGTEEAKERGIEALYAAHLLHIEDFQDFDPHFAMGKTMERGAEYSEKLTKLRSITNYIGVKDSDQSPRPVSQVEEELDEQLSLVDEKVSHQLENRSKADGRIKEIESRLGGLKPFIALGMPLELLSGYRSIAVFVGMCDKKQVEAVSRALADYDTVEADTEEKERVVAVFVPIEDREQAASTLSEAGLQIISVPEGDGDPASITKALNDELVGLQEERKQIDLRLSELSSEYAEFLRSSVEQLTTKVEKADAPLHFAQGTHTWACDGWLPTEKVEQVKAELDAATDGKVHLELLDAKEEGAGDKDIPVAYDNPRMAHPLEPFTDVFGRPLYREIDPTIILFILVPIFYGFMLGDIGYGALILALGFVLCRYLTTPGWRGLLNTMKLAAGMSIFFGFVYGEFFGFEIFGEHSIFGIHDMEPILIRFGVEGHAADVAKSWIPMLLVITVLVGIAHMSMGYLFGFRNELKAHGLMHAVTHKLSWLLVLLGGALAVADIFPALMGPPLVNFTNLWFMIGVGMALAGVALILKAHGVLGILEIPSLLSNTLSYTRLLAVGLASVGIAFAINLISLELLPDMLGELLGGILGVMVIVIGHIANTALGILSPGLHAIRLQYVEFFTKFYTGGGRKYNPFGYVRKYTEE